MLATIPSQERQSVWDEIEAALGQFETPDGFLGPCEPLVAAGTR